MQLVTITPYVFSHAVGTKSDLSMGWNRRLSVQSLFVRVFGGHRVSFRLYMTVSGSTRRNYVPILYHVCDRASFEIAVRCRREGKEEGLRRCACGEV